MLKIKPLTKEQIVISIDRLTRFKHPEDKYLRVFKDIILSNLIDPKFKKVQLDLMPYAELSDYAEKIINTSLIDLGFKDPQDYSINEKILENEVSTFVIDDKTMQLLDNKINYEACCELIDQNSSINLLWLKSLSKRFSDFGKGHALRYPLNKIVISEGITEEILLPKFADICDYNFDKNGVYIISAGGKNQVVKLFYKLVETVKLPIFVLMDNDAQFNYEEIKPKLRKIDKVHLIKSGEFEDVLPLSLIKKALCYGLNNISIVEDKMITENDSMVKNLEEIFRHRGMHEFKKAEFAHMVEKTLFSDTDISSEILEIIEEIKQI